jgi:hypothetical protein
MPRRTRSSRRTAAYSPNLGTLTSKLDDNTELPALFTDVQEQVASIREQLVAEQLDQRSAAAVLSTLRIESPDGTLWSMGARTLQWYRKFPSGTWSLAAPPLGDCNTAYQLAEPVVAEVGAPVQPVSDVPLPDLDAPPALDQALAQLPEISHDPGQGSEGRHEPLELPRLVPPKVAEGANGREEEVAADGPPNAGDESAEASSDADEDSAGLAALEAYLSRIAEADGADEADESGYGED